MVDEAEAVAVRSALIFSSSAGGSLSQALNGRTTILDRRPLAPFSVLGAFFGRADPLPSSLFRFLGCLGRFAATLAVPFGIWPFGAAAGGGDPAKGVDNRAKGWTEIESDEPMPVGPGTAGIGAAGRGTVTEIESFRTRGPGAGVGGMLFEGPLKDGLELSLIFLGSEGFSSGGGGGGARSIHLLYRGRVRYCLVNRTMHRFLPFDRANGGFSLAAGTRPHFQKLGYLNVMIRESSGSNMAEQMVSS